MLQNLNRLNPKGKTPRDICFFGVVRGCSHRFSIFNFESYSMIQTPQRVHALEHITQTLQLVASKG